LFLQVIFGLCLLFIDTFFDVGDGFHSFLHQMNAFTRTNIFEHHSNDTICVPGGGFSGFWFTLGRFHSLEHPQQKNYLDTPPSSHMQAKNPSNGKDLTTHSFQATNTLYECFSAGCLVVVATALDRSFEEVLGLAQNSQLLWQQGKLSRYDIVEHFVDGLLNNTCNINLETCNYSGNGDRDALSRIKIVTSSLNLRDPRYGLFTYHSRSPLDIHQLKEMLLQTTWIPYATGNVFRLIDRKKGDYHIDGAFSATAHPRCSRKMGLPLSVEFIMSSLNPAIERSHAVHFYNLGLNANR